MSCACGKSKQLPSCFDVLVLYTTEVDEDIDLNVLLPNGVSVSFEALNEAGMLTFATIKSEIFSEATTLILTNRTNFEIQYPIILSGIQYKCVDTRPSVRVFNADGTIKKYVNVLLDVAEEREPPALPLPFPEAIRFNCPLTEDLLDISLKGNNAIALGNPIFEEHPKLGKCIKFATLGDMLKNLGPIGSRFGTVAVSIYTEDIFSQSLVQPIVSGLEYGSYMFSLTEPSYLYMYGANTDYYDMTWTDTMIGYVERIIFTWNAADRSQRIMINGILLSDIMPRADLPEISTVQYLAGNEQSELYGGQTYIGWMKDWIVYDNVILSEQQMLDLDAYLLSRLPTV